MKFKIDLVDVLLVLLWGGALFLIVTLGYTVFTALPTDERFTKECLAAGYTKEECAKMLFRDKWE